MNKKTIFITGIIGQDGSYLAKLLLSHSYNIIGLVRDKEYIDLSKPNYLDLSDAINVDNIKFIVCGGGDKKSIEEEAKSKGIVKIFRYT
jgi:GDP-D-mannose dehydratase